MTDRQVAIVLRNRGDLFCRADQADGERRLSPVAVPLGQADPQTAVEQWLQQRTAGATEQFQIVRTGDTVRAETGEAYVPALVDSEQRAIDGEQTGSYCWVEPSALCAQDAPSWPWLAYDAVRPSIATVAEDTAHGSATLSRRALEVLRDEALHHRRQDREATDGKKSGTEDRLQSVARDLRDARPSMAVVRNRLNRVMSEADPIAPETVASAAQRGIERAIRADEATAESATEFVEGARVATLSRSGTVLAALEQGAPDAVLVAESRPGGEGVGVAERLAGQTDVTLTTDAAFPAQLSEWAADVFLIGADTVGPDGRVRNKVGTLPAATVATGAGIPVVVAAACDKISPELTADDDSWPGVLYDGDESLTVANPTFDLTPPEYVDTLVTERGHLEADDVAAIAAEHERQARWEDATGDA